MPRFTGRTAATWIINEREASRRVGQGRGQRLRRVVSQKGEGIDEVASFPRHSCSQGWSGLAKLNTMIPGNYGIRER